MRITSRLCLAGAAIIITNSPAALQPSHLAIAGVPMSEAKRGIGQVIEDDYGFGAMRLTCTRLGSHAVGCAIRFRDPHGTEWCGAGSARLMGQTRNMRVRDDVQRCTNPRFRLIGIVPMIVPGPPGPPNFPRYVPRWPGDLPPSGPLRETQWI
jgi:hypothetical protein